MLNLTPTLTPPHLQKDLEHCDIPPKYEISDDEAAVFAEFEDHGMSIVFARKALPEEEEDDLDYDDHRSLTSGRVESTGDRVSISDQVSSDRVTTGGQVSSDRVSTGGEASISDQVSSDRVSTGGEASIRGQVSRGQVSTIDEVSTTPQAPISGHLHIKGDTVSTAKSHERVDVADEIRKSRQVMVAARLKMRAKLAPLAEPESMEGLDEEEEDVEMEEECYFADVAGRLSPQGRHLRAIEEQPESRIDADDEMESEWKKEMKRKRELKEQRVIDEIRKLEAEREFDERKVIEDKRELEERKDVEDRKEIERNKLIEEKKETEMKELAKSILLMRLADHVTS